MYKQNLALNNLQGLIYHKIKATDPPTFAPLAGTVEYIDCFSAKGVRPLSPTSVLHMTLNK